MRPIRAPAMRLQPPGRRGCRLRPAPAGTGGPDGVLTGAVGGRLGGGGSPVRPPHRAAPRVRPPPSGPPSRTSAFPRSGGGSRRRRGGAAPRARGSSEASGQAASAPPRSAPCARPKLPNRVRWGPAFFSSSLRRRRHPLSDWSKVEKVPRAPGAPVPRGSAPRGAARPGPRPPSTPPRPGPGRPGPRRTVGTGERGPGQRGGEPAGPRAYPLPRGEVRGQRPPKVSGVAGPAPTPPAGAAAAGWPS